MQVDRQYRAVVALNNLGVSLLEQGRQGHAQTTLLDAMTLLKPAFQGLSDDSSLSESSRGSPDVDDVLAQAHQRYARTLAGVLPADNAPVLVVTSLADAADLQTAAGDGRSSPLLHPIRLELNDHEVLLDHRPYNKEEVFITCFVIVHNCSIAHFLTTDFETAKESTRQKPFKMLEACHRILLGLGMCISNHHALRQQAYLDFITHKTYMDMLRLARRSEGARLNARRLEHLRDGLDQAILFDRMMNISESAVAFAPAA
jgi:hypothetical protein